MKYLLTLLFLISCKVEFVKDTPLYKHKIKVHRECYYIELGEYWRDNRVCKDTLKDKSNCFQSHSHGESNIPCDWFEHVKSSIILDYYKDKEKKS